MANTTWSNIEIKKYSSLFDDQNKNYLHDSYEYVWISPTKLTNFYEKTEYPLADNSDMSCDDKYLTKADNADLNLEPSNLMEDKWQCQTLTRQQLECN